jgi:pimeloyl-ACP methyl ester carboxylesterase
MVLLHGLASSAHTWDALAPLLAPTFRVVALDERGHGESAKPDTGYDLATFVADLAGVLEALRPSLGDERPIVIGHSWGAHVALAYAATFPQALSHLVLVDGGINEMQSRPDLTWEIAEKQMTPPDITMPLPAFVERMRNRLGPIYSDQVRDAILGNVWVDERGVVHPHLTRAHHLQLARAIFDHRPGADFDRVRCPTLIVVAEPAEGTGDPERLRWKRRAVAIAEQRLPHARILWLRETMHDIQLHRPAILANAIRQFVQTTGDPIG